MQDTSSEIQEPIPQDINTLTALHIAEYNALMERCTYYILMHVSLWGVVVAVVAAAVQHWT